MAKIEMFTSTTCTRCPILEAFIQKNGIDVVKRVIDTDPEAETDAFMFNIYALPALRVNDDVLLLKDIMDKDKKLYEEKILEFVHRGKDKG